jgi:adenylate cyclase
MLAVTVTNERQQRQFDHAAGPLEFGRGLLRDTPRCVIDDPFVSRDQLRVEELPNGRVRLKNLSQRNPAFLSDGSGLATSESRELPLPLTVRVGDTRIVLAHKSDAESEGPVTARPGALPAAPGAFPSEPAPRDNLAADGYRSLQPVRRQDLPRSLPGPGPGGTTLEPATLARWMETVLALQRSDAGPAEFYAQAARSLVSLVGLDVGLVLLHGDRGWEVVARAARDDDGRPGTLGREYSQTVLRQVLEEKQTFYQDLALMQAQESLRSVDAVVVSPVFGLQDELVGALYGMRRRRKVLTDCKIQPLEAQLVQLLAAAVGANLARAAATRTRTQFEQFFSADLARELARNPALLDGRGQEVTVLVSDLRGFSTLSERLGPQDTCRLVRDLMERLSVRIVEQAGVIVSYLGDGLLAMWNAPAAQADHAARACRAALAIREEMPALSAAWQAVAGAPLKIGIGVNTGLAQVGNTGSSRKFMYGPLGNSVNVASRVEGATKHLGVPVLITGPTLALAGDAFATRRLCQLRVAGIQSPVDLYELHGETASAEWLAFRDRYEQALALYEGRQWFKTCQILLALMEESGGPGQHDQPTLKLARRAFSCLESPPDPFDPVMDLSGK